MYSRIVVPIDGSDFSWRAFAVAQHIARYVDASIELVEVVSMSDDMIVAAQYIRERLADIPDLDRERLTVSTLEMGENIPATLAAHVESIEGSLIVMSSVGRGRSAAVIGSVAEELLRATFGPIVVIGPGADLDRPLDGPLVVAVDGSATSEAMLPLAGAWGIELGATPWVVSVAHPEVRTVPPDVAETSYPARLARHLAQQTHRDVEFEVLHNEHPAEAIAKFAEDVKASFVFAGTHGRTGMARISAGSVAMSIVHRSPCPVVLSRQPHLASDVTP